MQSHAGRAGGADPQRPGSNEGVAICPWSQSRNATLVALLRSDGSWWRRAISAIEQAGSADAVLAAELGLFADQAHDDAAAQIVAWEQRGIELVSFWDPRFPASLRASVAPPPLLFTSGQLAPEDGTGVAVIGARLATDDGLAVAAAVVGTLAADGYTIVSGLALGIDAVAHRTALAAGGRTVAAIGCGLDHCYPGGHAALARGIAHRGAVVSQFWPEQPPARQTFPARNRLMAALTRATVIVEAGPRSGTRIQARAALENGRAVVLLPGVMGQDWAQELAARSGVRVAQTPGEVSEAIECLSASSPTAAARG